MGQKQICSNHTTVNLNSLWGGGGRSKLYIRPFVYPSIRLNGGLPEIDGLLIELHLKRKYLFYIDLTILISIKLSSYYHIVVVVILKHLCKSLMNVPGIREILPNPSITTSNRFLKALIYFQIKINRILKGQTNILISSEYRDSMLYSSL